MVKGFSKMYNFSFFGQFFFCKHFYYITGFCDKKFNFCKFANFFADSKSRAQELSNDASIVIFGLQTWDFDPPPQRILVFKYPSRDRVNVLWQNQKFIDTLSLLFRSIYLCIFILLSSWKGMVLLNGGFKTITFVRTVCL